MLQDMKRSLAECKGLHSKRLDAMEQRCSDQLKAARSQQQDALRALDSRRMAQFNDMMEVWDKQEKISQQQCEMLTAELQRTEKAAEAKFADVRKEHADELEGMRLQLANTTQSAATQVADAVAAGKAQLEKSDKQHADELELLKSQSAEQSQAERAESSRQQGVLKAAHHAELDALRTAHISETKAMVQTGESVKQKYDAQLADSDRKLKWLQDRSMNTQNPYGLRNYWLHAAEDAKAKCNATTVQLQDKCQRSDEAAQAAQLAQQRVQSKAAELLKDLIRTSRQLEQAQCKFEAELSAAAAHRAERMSVKEAEVQALTAVSSLSQKYNGLLHQLCQAMYCLQFMHHQPAAEPQPC